MRKEHKTIEGKNKLEEYSKSMKIVDCAGNTKGLVFTHLGNFYK
jgi:hypothetical protein